MTCFSKIKACMGVIYFLVCVRKHKSNLSTNIRTTVGKKKQWYVEKCELLSETTFSSYFITAWCVFFYQSVYTYIFLPMLLKYTENNQTLPHRSHGTLQILFTLMHNRPWHWPLLVESMFTGFSNQIRRMAMLSSLSFLAETTTVSRLQVVRKPHFMFKNVSDSDVIIRMESRISRNVNIKIVLCSASWWALQHLNRTNRVILVN